MVNRYPFRIEWSEDDQEYIATCPAFPGLSAFGATEEEALREGKVALAGFFETCQEKGIALPATTERTAHSGKLNLRLSKTQHRLAAQMAETEGVSLNTYIADAVTARITGQQVARPVIEELKRQFAITSTQVASALTVQPMAQYSKKITTEMVTTEQVISLPVDERRKRGN